MSEDERHATRTVSNSSCRNLARLDSIDSLQQPTSDISLLAEPMDRRPRGFQTLAVVLYLLLPAAGHCARLTWNNPVGGSWNDSLNWSPHLVPGAADTAEITLPGAYHVLMDGGVSAVRSIHVGSGSGSESLLVAQGYRFTLVVAESLEVRAGALLDLDSPTLAGTAVLVNRGTLLVANSGRVYLPIENYGLFSPRSDQAAELIEFHNHPGATIRIGQLCIGPGNTFAACTFDHCTNEGLFEVVNKPPCLGGSAGTMVNTATGVSDYTRFGHSALNFTLENHGLIRIGATVVKLASIVNFGRMTMNASMNSTGVDNREGGVIDGTGWINGLTNAGTVRPGAPIGTLLIRSPYTQTPTGMLELDVNGPGSSDHLDVQGLATLAGSLRIRTLGAYLPAPGLVWTPMTMVGRSGSFATVVNAFQDGVPLFDPQLGANSLDLHSLGKGITSFSPSVGGDSSNVTVIFTGGGMAGITGIRLSRAGENDILGTTPTVSSTGTECASTFDLSAAARGAWDVVVSFMSGPPQTLPAAFTIEARRAPQVSVQLIGRGAVVPTVPSVYRIVIANTGNCDAIGSVRLTVPANASYRIRTAPAAFAQVRELGGGAVAKERTVQLPEITIPPGGTYVDLTIELTRTQLGSDVLRAQWVP